MLVSPFTPLFFRQNVKTDGLPSKYIQVFAPTDVILIEVIGEENHYPNAEIKNILSGISNVIVWNYWDINAEQRLYFTTITGLTVGCYKVNISGIGDSQPFKITTDETDLSQTTLIQYSNKDNRQRLDAVFHINKMQYFFDFRVPGGFQDNGWTFGVDNEQFVTELSDIVELYAMDSTQNTFTLGTNIGCPVWYAELLNRLLCCNYIYFDGVRYARKDTSVPEMTIQMEGLNSFVFKQILQKVKNINPAIEDKNQTIIRRIDNTYYNAIDINSDGNSNNYYQRLIKY